MKQVYRRRSLSICIWLGPFLVLLLTLTGCAKRSETPSTVVQVPTGSSIKGSELEQSKMVLLKGGRFRMGTADGMPYEGPVHEVELRQFWIDQHDVTVGEFAKFITATGYKTDAENLGWSGVFNTASEEWQNVDGADWRHPDGPESSPNQNEPVTQVSWNDAAEYAKWAGKRLPTEAEWEYAARGGLDGDTYWWGNELRPHGKPVANWWQGHFPENNTGEDGFIRRSPVDAFPKNGYGLSDMAGNVWQWCADWYADDFYKSSPKVEPVGPTNGDERVIRGGSWLCSENYCTNYRVAARSHTPPDSGLNNLGFRCVRSE